MFKTLFSKRRKRYNVLVIGGSGMLGFDLVKLLKSESLSENGIIGIVDAPTSGELDASVYCNVSSYLRHKRKFDYIINCAAETDTKRCEKELFRSTSFSSNVEIVRNIARACDYFGCKMIQVSTNEVFSDRKHPYGRNCFPNPSSVYGMEKYIAELEIEKMLPKTQYTIIRASWLFGLHRSKSFVHKCVENFIRYSKSDRTKPMFGIVDECSTPTSTKFLSNLILRTIYLDKCGLYHAVQNGGTVSRYSYMGLILDNFHNVGEFSDITMNDVQPMKTEDCQGIRKVGNIVLSYDEYHEIFYYGCGWDWMEDLKRMITEHGAEIVKEITAKVDGELKCGRE